MTSIEVTTDSVGPLFDGSATAVTADMTEAIRDSIAREAEVEVHINLDRSIRNPTPYYETQIINEVAATNRVVHDRGIIYGPWLEGVSRRNKATRFKGYASFRRARQAVERRIPDIAAKVADRYLRQLGGS